LHSAVIPGATIQAGFVGEPALLGRIRLCKTIAAPKFVPASATISSGLPRNAGPCHRAALCSVIGLSGFFGAQFPLPLKAKVCGDPCALSAIAIDAVAAPPVVGAKLPSIVQLAPTASLDPQLFVNRNDDASLPVTLMLEIFSADPPVLVSVTD